MRCHYAVLGVARGATEDDIRKAYRKLVIALHPDKAQQRGEDPQKATEAFREVQAAYECLYDEQERAYYDANRDAILRGEDPDEYEVEPPTPQKRKGEERNATPRTSGTRSKRSSGPSSRAKRSRSSTIAKANKLL